MNTKKIYQGKFQDYSFKDLEYGVKLLLNDIIEIDHAIKTMRHIVNTAKGTKSQKYYSKSRFEDVERDLEKRKNDIVEAINRCQEEIAERLLTGNDDGVIERELLGASHV